MQNSWLYVRLVIRNSSSLNGSFTRCTSFRAQAYDPCTYVHAQQPGYEVRSLLPLSARGRSWLRDSSTLFSMGGSKSYFAEGLNRLDASFLLVNTTSNLTCSFQQMFLLFRVMEILWTIFSSSCSLGGSSRPKMPSGTQWSPPKMHFRVTSLADQGDTVKPVSCGLGSSEEPDTICNQLVV